MKKKPAAKIGWAIADRISDRIVDLVNAELELMRKADRVEPLQLLAGQLLALKALQRTMPATAPLELVHLYDRVDRTLEEILATRKK